MKPFGKSALGIVRRYHPEVVRVIDAKKSLTIKVTKNDCKKGNSGSRLARVRWRKHVCVNMTER